MFQVLVSQCSTLASGKALWCFVFSNLQGLSRTSSSGVVQAKLCLAGNTCFVNVALQCLRYTPKLPQAIYPDLVRFSLIEQEPVAMPVSPGSRTAAAWNAEPSHSGSELPSVPETAALANEPIQISSPTASLNSQVGGSALSGLNSNKPYPQHSMHSTGQADPILNGAEPQHSVHSMSQQSQIPMLQLLQDQTGEHPDLHPSQPVSIPPSHTGMAPHSHSGTSPQEQLPNSSPEYLAGSLTVSVSESPGGVADTSGSNATGEGPLVQQRQQQQQQQPQQQRLSGEAAQPMATADSMPGDDSEKAPANQSTATRQPPPVAVPRAPLKKGEIAESFRTLVKQVTNLTGFTLLFGPISRGHILRLYSFSGMHSAPCSAICIVCGAARVGSW